MYPNHSLHSDYQKETCDEDFRRGVATTVHDIGLFEITQPILVSLSNVKTCDSSISYDFKFKDYCAKGISLIYRQYIATAEGIVNRPTSQFLAVVSLVPIHHRHTGSHLVPFKRNDVDIIHKGTTLFNFEKVRGPRLAVQDNLARLESPMIAFDLKVRGLKYPHKLQSQDTISIEVDFHMVSKSKGLSKEAEKLSRGSILYCSFDIDDISDQFEIVNRMFTVDREGASTATLIVRNKFKEGACENTITNGMWLGQAIWSLHPQRLGFSSSKTQEEHLKTLFLKEENLLALKQEELEDKQESQKMIHEVSKNRKMIHKGIVAPKEETREEPECLTPSTFEAENLKLGLGEPNVGLCLFRTGLFGFNQPVLVNLGDICYSTLSIKYEAHLEDYTGEGHVNVMRKGSLCTAFIVLRPRKPQGIYHVYSFYYGLLFCKNRRIFSITSSIHITPSSAANNGR